MKGPIKLFEKAKIGNLEVDHRFVMSPLTRARAGRDGIPTDSMVTYYKQRASAALIISEATHISPEAYTWVNAPGIFTEEQIEGWKRVTAAVHEKGGRMFLQLWHGGAVSHSSLRPDNQLPVAPSAIKLAGEVHIGNGEKVPYETSRALELAEIPEIVGQYKTAAQNALRAEFDGVELHSAGYLPQQFLDDTTNLRTDEYGGSIESRSRFVLQIIEALADVFGGDRVGVKIAPGISSAGTPDSNPNELYQYLVGELNTFNLAYLHVLERIIFAEMGIEMRPDVDHARLKSDFNGAYIANGNYDARRAEQSLLAGAADFIAFGKPFIANPDLVSRIRSEAPLNIPNVDTFYSGGDEGYIDYPNLSEANGKQ